MSRDSYCDAWRPTANPYRESPVPSSENYLSDSRTLRRFSRILGLGATSAVQAEAGNST